MHALKVFRSPVWLLLHKLSSPHYRYIRKMRRGDPLPLTQHSIGISCHVLIPMDKITNTCSVVFHPLRYTIKNVFSGELIYCSFIGQTKFHISWIFKKKNTQSDEIDLYFIDLLQKSTSSFACWLSHRILLSKTTSRFLCSLSQKKND